MVLPLVSVLGKHSVIARFEDTNSNVANRTLSSRMTVVRKARQKIHR